MNHKPVISLCMITKNEEKYLDQCLRSVEHLVDEMIVVDTGSTDRTIEIAKEHNAKLFTRHWKSDFADARNYALSKATGDWILILDADEAFDMEGLVEKDCNLKTFLEVSQSDGFLCSIINYTGKLSSEEYTIHYMIRLFRNHKGYHYEGAIHEQLVSAQSIDVLPFDTSPFRIHHYGYLDEVVNAKQKRARNKPIIERLLKKNPNDPFQLFNLGNEYLCEENYEKAIECYLQSYKNKEVNSSFMPYLYIRLVFLLTLKRDYTEALRYSEEGLQLFKDFTDLAYSKALIHYESHQYTLALDAFQHCIDMKEAPFLLRFFDGCSTYKPYLGMAEIYRRLNDYNRALDCYQNAFIAKPTYTSILPSIAEILFKKYDSQEAIQQFLKFREMQNTSAVLYTIIDTLINYRQYDFVRKYLQELDHDSTHSLEKQFFTAKLDLFTDHCENAAQGFSKILRSRSISIQNPYVEKSYQYLFTSYLVSKDSECPKLITRMKAKGFLPLSKVCEDIFLLHQSLEPNTLTEADNAQITLPFAIDILSVFLHRKDFDNFEKYLYVLNRIESKKVLVELAKVYDHFDYPLLAIQTIFKSLKDLEIIDVYSLDYLAGMNYLMPIK